MRPVIAEVHISLPQGRADLITAPAPTRRRLLGEQIAQRVFETTLLVPAGEMLLQHPEQP